LEPKPHVLLDVLSALLGELPKLLTPTNHSKDVLVVPILHKRLPHLQHLVVAVKLKPNHVLALLPLVVLVAIFALRKNVAWSVKLTNQVHHALGK